MKETTFMSEIDDYHDDHTSLSWSLYKTWLTENCSNSGCAFQLCVVKVFFCQFCFLQYSQIELELVKYGIIDCAV